MAKKDEIAAVGELDLSTASVDNFELTEAEKLEIEAEARRDVAKEMKAQKRKAFKDGAMRRIKAQTLFQDGKDESGAETMEIELNLAPAQHYISLDGARYHHGKKYTLPLAKVRDIQDMQYRGWKEESARLGEDMNGFYGRQKHNAVLGPQGLRR